jgi:hypothetical protein
MLMEEPLDAAESREAKRHFPGRVSQGEKHPMRGAISLDRQRFLQASPHSAVNDEGWSHRYLRAKRILWAWLAAHSSRVSPLQVDQLNFHLCVFWIPENNPFALAGEDSNSNSNRNTTWNESDI